MKKSIIIPAGYHRYVVTVRYAEGDLSVVCYAETSFDALYFVATRHPHAIIAEVSLSDSK